MNISLQPSPAFRKGEFSLPRIRLLGGILLARGLDRRENPRELLGRQTLGEFIARIGRDLWNHIEILLEIPVGSSRAAPEKLRCGFNCSDFLGQRRGYPDIERDSILSCQFFGSIQKRFRNLE